MIGPTNAKGGGGGLSLKVIGGTAKPANPRENVIWINTNISIASYILSPTQPETATDGMVWLRTADSGVEINAGRKNAVLLCLGNAALYAGGTWTYVEGYIYTSSKWVQFSSERLPAEYQEVEFLQSVGSTTSNNTGQYINTELTIENTHYGFDVKFNTQNTNGTGSAFGVILGTRKSSGNEEFNVMTYDGSQFRYWNKQLPLGIVRNTDQIFSLHSGNYIKPNGDKGKIDKYVYNVKNPLTIFALNNSGTVYQYGRLMLYYLKLYDDSDKLIADYIPCYRKKDKEPGLWDSVSRKFLTNAGTGAFVVGGDIT